MVIQQILSNGLIKTTSDKGKYLLQIETGVKYAEAIDVPNRYTYVETNEDVEDQTK